MYDAIATSSLKYTTLVWSSSGIIRDGLGDFAAINDSQDVLVPTTSKIIMNVATSVTSTAYRTYNNFTVGGTLTHTTNEFATTGAANLYRINYQVNGDFILGSSASINLDGRGYGGGMGPGAGVTSVSIGGGASHGGLGKIGEAADPKVASPDADCHAAVGAEAPQIGVVGIAVLIATAFGSNRRNRIRRDHRRCNCNEQLYFHDDSLLDFRSS
jgi:hypothetical protein